MGVLITLTAAILVAGVAVYYGGTGALNSYLITTLRGQTPPIN